MIVASIEITSELSGFRTKLVEHFDERYKVSVHLIPQPRGCWLKIGFVVSNH